MAAIFNGLHHHIGRGAEFYGRFGNASLLLLSMSSTAHDRVSQRATTRPFAEFAPPIRSQSALREAVTAAYRRPEPECLPPLVAAATLPQDTKQDIAGQTREVLGHIDRLLGEVDSDKSLLLSVQIYLADMKDFPGMNAVWDTWVVQGATPPRATVEAKLANPECLVEIVVVAAQRG